MTARRHRRFRLRLLVNKLGHYNKVGAACQYFNTWRDKSGIWLLAIAARHTTFSIQRLAAHPQRDRTETNLVVDCDWEW